jgi:hypothetical protein
MLNIFTTFHLNLMYSAIEEADRPTVIRQVYWPLLELIEKEVIPLGLELSALTLELIAAIDPAWVKRLATLWAADRCEVIGAGYSQTIGPLWPESLHRRNCEVGMAVYQRLLGRRPTLALVNEQAYSSALLPAYKAAGYQGIIMEWDNPASQHPDWNTEWRYHPHHLYCNDTRLPVIWNASICYQKVQRFVHGEITEGELKAYFEQHKGSGERYLCVYGGDAEIFNFRPGRYRDEVGIKPGEWPRLAAGFRQLAALPEVRWVRPSEVLTNFDHPFAGQLLRLETPACPVPVKKQEKYNISRWAVTGRDDLDINTRCMRLFHQLKSLGTDDDAPEWIELLYLSSSDFRTHCTALRWAGYQTRLAVLEALTGTRPPERITEGLTGNTRVTIRREHRFLIAESCGAKLVLNCRRGLAVQSCQYDAVSPQSLFGTVDHGYFSRMDLSADFYTGNLVAEQPGRPKITDLAAVEPVIGADTECHLVVEGVIRTPLGPVRKRLRWQAEERWLECCYTMDWPEPFIGSLRLGHLLLNPAAYDQATLFYNTRGHGDSPEAFRLSSQDNFDHGRAINLLISSAQGFGVPEGDVCMGDSAVHINVSVDTELALPLGQITYQKAEGESFLRLCFSLSEVDETRLIGAQGKPQGWQFKVRYTATLAPRAVSKSVT